MKIPLNFVDFTKISYYNRAIKTFIVIFVGVL